MGELGYGERFDGFEFDWFAVDADGQIGLFSSGGYGEIPAAVRSQFQAYDDVADQFELPNFGTEAVWQDYAPHGLYVYDWRHYSGPYIRKATPTAEMSPELRQQILQLPGLPRLGLLFVTTPRIVVPR